MKNYDGEERRMSRRFPFREDILIDGAKQCTCNDISEDGIFISAIQIFDEGEMIEVTIPFGEERITVKGQIKYCQQGIGMGVMFHDLNDEHKVKIKTLVDRISANSS
jgi:hypothetical protein